MSSSWSELAWLVGVHQPGRSWLHRCPAGPKVVGLVLAVVVLQFTDRWIMALVAMILSVGVLLSARLPVRRRLAGPFRSVVVIVLALGGLQVWILGWESAVVGVSRILAMLALAWAVSLTTPLTHMLTILRRVLLPVQLFGRDPERAAMTIALAIRSIPLVLSAAGRADEARRARTAPPSIRALVVPTVVRSVKVADALGDALLARGYPPDRD